MELKKITSCGPQEMLVLGRWTLDQPEESKQQWNGWEQELATRKAAREQADAELALLTSDHRRLSKLEAETLKSSTATIAGIRSEAIRNPACDFDGLAGMEAKEVQRARFITNVIQQLVTVDIPKQVTELARVVWQEKEASTQCWTYATAHVYGEYLDLLAPLAAAQGMTATSQSPKMVQYEEAMLKARAEERQAHEDFVKAESDWFNLSRANQASHL